MHECLWCTSESLVWEHRVDPWSWASFFLKLFLVSGVFCMLGWPGPSDEQSWNKASIGNKGKKKKSINRRTHPLEFKDISLQANCVSRNIITSEWHISTPALLAAAIWCKTKWNSFVSRRHLRERRVLLNSMSYVHLTSPCLRRPRSHTQILPHWTAPSPPLVKGGSREGREEAWGWVAREADSQTAGNRTTRLSLQTPPGSTETFHERLLPQGTF